MSVKVFVSNEDRQKVARQLLDAAEDPSEVRLEKSRGLGFVITDRLAAQLGLTEDSNITKSPETEPDRPKRGGRPRSSKNKERSDGE
jgi:hypothetical protein